MRTMKSLSCGLVFSALVLATSGVAQSPLGSAMTYQGQLKDASQPADGTFMMQFSLWDAPGTGSPPVGGNQVGPTLRFDGHAGNPPPVTVSDGLFAVNLDFGSSAFAGEARWLQISVNGTPLSPRHPMTAAPYAMYALNGPGGDGHSLDAADGNPSDALFVDADGRVGIGTTTPNMPLTIQPTGASRWIQFRDASGVNKFHFTDEGGFNLANGSGASRLFVATGGNVGIGQQFPAQKLDVAGGLRVSGGIIQNGGSTLTATTNLGLYSTTQNSWMRLVTADGDIRFFTDAAQTNDFVGGTADMVIHKDGAVGIGALNSTARLHVAGPGTALGNHVAVFENLAPNSADGIAIKVATVDVNRDNNFVTFYNGANQVVGRIEGFDRDHGDFDPPDVPSTSISFSAGSFPTISLSWSDPADFPYISYPTNVSLSGGSLPSLSIVPPDQVDIANTTCWATESGFLGLMSINPLDLVSAGATIAAAEACNDGGVVYGSKGADYAEWLPKLDPQEKFRFGQLVGIYGGKVSLRTEGADQIMAISVSPVVLGNQPEPDRQNEYVSVGFIGQVPVLVRGECQSGDFIVASGFEDGTAIAVSPSDLEIDELDRVLGRAWSASNGSPISVINVAIGIQSADAAQILQKHDCALQTQRSEMDALRNQLSDSQRQIAALVSRMEHMEKALIGSDR